MLAEVANGLCWKCGNHPSMERQILCAACFEDAMPRLAAVAHEAMISVAAAHVVQLEARRTMKAAADDAEAIAGMLDPTGDDDERIVVARGAVLDLQRRFTAFLAKYPEAST